MKIGVVEDGKLNEVLSSRGKLLTLEEESKSTESLTSQSGELVENASIGEVRLHRVLFCLLIFLLLCHYSVSMPLYLLFLV